MSDITVDGHLKLGEQRLIAQLQLNITAGCWNVLLGSSGLGKTSLARLIAGLPTKAVIDGTIQDRFGAPIAPNQVAMMAQNDQLLPWATAYECVTICARLRGEKPDRMRAEQLLVGVGLADMIGRKPATLSAGQRQRVVLARTLYENRPVVILDEPFSALDVMTRHHMQDLAVQQLKGRTVILITHDPAEALRLAQRAWILRPDGAVPIDLPETLIPRSSELAETQKAQAALFRQLAISAAATPAESGAA